MVTRSALPQNYQPSHGTLLENFDTPSDWSTASSTATDIVKSADTTNYISTSALKLVGRSGGSGKKIQVDKTVSIDLAGKNAMELWFYCHDPIPSAKLTQIELHVATSAAFADETVFILLAYELRYGWNILRVSGRRWAQSVGTTNWGSIAKLRVTIRLVDNETTLGVTLAGIYHSCITIPQICITFDDTGVERYTDYFPYLQALGLPATCYIVPAVIGQPGYLTIAQLEEMYDAGWCIANHTYTHQTLTTLTLEEQMDIIQRGADWLDDLGLSRGSHHVAYPTGAYNADTVTAMAQLGMLTGRSTESRNNYNSPPLCNLNFYTLGAFTPATLENMQLHQRDAQYGGSGYIMYHHYGPPDDGASVTTIKTMFDYIATTKIKCMTIDEWYNGLTNPRYRSLPVTRV